MSSVWLGVAVLVAAAFEVIGGLVYIDLIGKERKTVTSSDAVTHSIFAGTFAVLLVLAGLRLLGR